MNKIFLKFVTLISTFQFVWGIMDSQATISHLKEQVKTFVDERAWNKEPAHDIRNISISIACEAAELLEIFNWQPESDIPTILAKNIQDIKNEAADVAFALLDFCNQLKIDLSDALDEKLLFHSKKYPANEVYIRTYVTDNLTTVSSLKDNLDKFAKARNWNHSIKSLCISITCEAAELLEIFNWKTNSEILITAKEKIQDIRYEVADIAFALLSFCNELDVDLSSAMEEKIKLNALKYPVKKS